jgi:hypothetical protein
VGEKGLKAGAGEAAQRRRRIDKRRWDENETKPTPWFVGPSEQLCTSALLSITIYFDLYTS